jgi:uncharacterized membrane protein YfcA
LTVEWLAAAGAIALASFVMGLIGFGYVLVAMALLPFLMSPVTAIAVLTIHTIVFSVAVFVPLRHHVRWQPVGDMVAGSLLGVPVGVWILSVFPVSVLNRLIGGTLALVVLMEWTGFGLRHLAGRGWPVGAGFLGGVAGSAVGTPGPPVIFYAATQGWTPRTIKANLQAFFVANQIVVLVGYWWAGLLTREVWRLALSFAIPAAIGTGLGMAVFAYVDPVKFRRLVFALLLIAGVTLILRG